MPFCNEKDRWIFHHDESQLQVADLDPSQTNILTSKWLLRSEGLKVQMKI